MSALAVRIVHQDGFGGRVRHASLRDQTVAMTARRAQTALTVCALLSVLIQAYAGAMLRGVYADGAFFANQILAHKGIVIIQPARSMAEMIDQWPVTAAMRLGMRTPHEVALAFSLTTNILPGIIMLLCLPALPRDARPFFVFPAFVYFAGTLTAQFASTTEGLVATSYVWLLLCLIAFGRLTFVRLVLILVLSAASLHLHEQMLFLGPVLAAACLLRWRDEKRVLPRAILGLAAICVLAGAWIGLEYLLHPLDVSERSAFFANLLGFNWLYVRGAGCNLPCALGIMAVLCICAGLLRPRWGRTTVVTFTALAVPLSVGAFWCDWLVVPSTQFFARDNGALISFPLGILLLLARLHGPTAVKMTQGTIAGIVVVLGLTVSLWHVSGTAKWSCFLAHFAEVLDRRGGIIPWNAVVQPAGSRAAVVSAMMMWPWTNPDLSLVALQRRCVTSVIDNPPGVGWQPYRVGDIATMPALRGATYVYLLPADRWRSACSAKAPQLPLRAREHAP